MHVSRGMGPGSRRMAYVGEGSGLPPFPREFTDLEKAICKQTVLAQNVLFEITDRLLAKERIAENASPLRLNLGGYSLAIRPQTIIKLAGRTKMHRFAQASHEVRLRICDAWMEDSGEYYFERSALTFNPIFQYFITGALHRPERVCPFDFLHELHYWEIPVQKVSSCCRHELMEQIKMARVHGNGTDSEEEELDRFEKMTCGTTRKSLWLLFEHPESSRPAQVIGLVSIGFVFASICALVLSSFEEFQRATEQERQIFDFTENCCTFWFTFEYVMKILISPKPLAVLLNFSSLVDLVAIAPFYVETLLNQFGEGIEKMQRFKSMFLVIRVLRVVRVMRIFKLGQYSRGMQVFALAMKLSTPNLVVFFVVLVVSCTFFSLISYFIDDQRFPTVPAAFWWSFVTMTTVGYGDIVPDGVFARMFATICIMSGTLVLAIPLPFIIDNWTKALFLIEVREQRLKNRQKKLLKKEEERSLRSRNQCGASTDTLNL